jgi:hypothetical protein
LAGAFHQRAAVSLFGRRISLPRRILFRLPAHSPPIHQFGVAVRPAHLIAAPHSLLFAGAFVANPLIWCCCSAGAFYRRAALSFVRPAHSPPIRRFGAISFDRRIPRRAATDLVLFRLAGASPPSRHRFGVVSFGRRIPRRFGLFVCRRIRRQPTDLVLLRLAGASPRCATIACLGWHIPMPIFLPAHPLAAPPSLFWPAHSFATPSLLSAGVFIRRAALLLLASAFIRHAALAFGRRFYSPRRPLASGRCIHSPRRPCFWPAYLFAVPIAIFRRRIPSPCHHRLSWSAHPIAAPPYRISLHARKQKRVSVSVIIENHGASHRRTSIAYLGLRFSRRDRLNCHAAMNHPHWAGALAVDC